MELHIQGDMLYVNRESIDSIVVDSDSAAEPESPKKRTNPAAYPETPKKRKH